MQNTDDTFSWDPESDQIFDFPGETTLRGPAETFNKIHGCGLDVYGITPDATQLGPLILVPDSAEPGVINWGVPSAATINSRFQFWEKADFRILGHRQLKNISVTDGTDTLEPCILHFNLFDDSCVRLENLQSVILGTSKLETMTSIDFSGIQTSSFFILAETIGLFYKATLSGHSTLDVQARAISTNGFYGAELYGLCFNDYSSLLLNARLMQHVDSELILQSSLSFHDSSHGNICARSIHNDVPDNNIGDFVAIDAFDNSTVDIHTAQFLQGTGKGKIIQLSGNANVTINPLNNITPINPVEEVLNPTEKCWPGMFNFKSGSKAVLKLNGNAIGTVYNVNALYILNLFYIDGSPVDIRDKFIIDYDSNGLTIKLK
ncbi:hypothetical protein GJ336_18330 [Escherichia coli]|nr:hypothetical protein [Escherichia coli]